MAQRRVRREERGVKKVNDVLALQVLKIEYDNAKKDLT